MLEHRSLGISGDANFVVVVGRMGTGKSRVIREFILVDHKYLNYDKLKELYARKHGMDLRDPSTAARVHDKTASLAHSYAMQFFKGSSSRLENIVVESTGQNMAPIEYYKNYALHSGYKPDRIHLVVVDAPLEVSIARNAARNRRLPTDDIIKADGLIRRNMPSMLAMFDSVWLVTTETTDTPWSIVRVKGGDEALSLHPIGAINNAEDEALRQQFFRKYL